MFWISTPRRGRFSEISPRLGKPSAEPAPALPPLLLPPGGVPIEGKPSPREGKPLLLLAKRLLEPLKSKSPLEEVLLKEGNVGVGSWEGAWERGPVA